MTLRHVGSKMAEARCRKDSPWSWFVCFAAFVIMTLNNGSYYSFGLFLPSLLGHFRQRIAITGKSFVEFYIHNLTDKSSFNK